MGPMRAIRCPQGLADFERVEVANPPAGTWTAVFFTEQNDFTPGALGTSGPIQWDATTLQARPAGFVFPASLTIGAGKTATAYVNVTQPVDGRVTPSSRSSSRPPPTPRRSR